MLDNILKKPHARRSFIIIIVVVLGIFLCLRYLALPHFDSTIKTSWAFIANFLDNAIISLLVTTFIGAFLFYITPDVVKSSNIEITEPRDLPALFENAFPSTELWWYKGGCGRYFRTKTLPEMALWARKTGLSREIRVVILDPMNTPLCEAHATYRRSTASAEQEKSNWNLDKVRHELYATIVIVLVTQLNEPKLRINLSLASHYSTFRIDLSSQYAIITKEDRKAPAIICYPDNYYYKSYKEEITLSESQNKHVSPLPHGSQQTTNLTKQLVEAILTHSNLVHPEMKDADFNEIARICREKRNPYG